MRRKRTAEDRVRTVIERWFLKEPALFAAMMTHRVAFCDVPTLRVGRGRVEISEAFVSALDERSLEDVLVAEASRILLKHPYDRRMPQQELAYLASNVTLKEHLRTALPFPTSYDLFGTNDFDRQYFELYYNRLAHREGETQGPEGAMNHVSSHVGSASGEGSTALMGALSNYARGDAESAALWETDPLLAARIDDVIHDVRASDRWGSLPGGLRERILLGLTPVVDYRSVLRSFRARVLSSERRWTRMVPSRRYEPPSMGHRPAFTTRLLFAVDVSGSMSTRDLTHALGVAVRFFHYGVRSIDILRFDAALQGPVLTLRRGQRELEIIGRGGTSFEPVIRFLDEHSGAYDGVVVFTDGIAPRPEPPKVSRIPIVWLFSTRKNWEQMRGQLAHVGTSAFVHNA